MNLIRRIQSIAANLRSAFSPQIPENLRALPLHRRIALFFSVTLSGFIKHRGPLHAAGLTYFSILAIVPIVCLIIVSAKFMGAGDLARSAIDRQIQIAITELEQSQMHETAAQQESAETPEAQNATAETFKRLETQAREFSNGVFDNIDRLDVSTLGVAGLVFLMWTTISMLIQIETAMNEVWEVDRPRPVWMRCSLYLMTAVVLPIFAAMAMSLPVLHTVKSILEATLSGTEYTRWAGNAIISFLDSRLLRIATTAFFAALTFGFILKFFPRRKVNVRAAFEGGAATALLFWSWLKLCTTAGVGIARSGMLYGSFATLPIILTWIYVSWQIVLLGSNITYALHILHNRGADPAAA